MLDRSSSNDRQDRVPRSELAKGERLRSTLHSPHFGRGTEDAGRCAQVLSVTVLQRTTPVYNIEVHGERVYVVGPLGVLVHNASPTQVRTGQRPFGYPSGAMTASAAPKLAAMLHKIAGQTVEQILKTKKGSIRNADLSEGSPSWRS